MFEEKFLEPHFTSVLAPYMLDVVEQKRALGNKYNAGVEALSAFDDFCNEQQLRIPEYKNVRMHLLKNLPGDKAWRHDKSLYPSNQPRLHTDEVR